MGFVPWGFWHDWELNASAAQASGIVTAVSKTQWSKAIGRHGEISWPIFEYDFKFTTPDGTEVNGVSYAESATSKAPHWKSRDQVTVEYLASHPAVSRIARARATIFGFSNLLGALVPIIFIFVFIWICLTRRRVVWMFKHGTLAEVSVMVVEPTKKKMIFNGQPIYKISLQPIRDSAGALWIMRDWHQDTIKLARERHASGHPVFLLYDPNKPKRLLLPEAWLDW